MKKLLILVLTLSCFLVGCQSNSTKPNHLNAAMFWVSTTLDPTNDYDGWVLSRIGVGETLMRLNEQYDVEPWLVSSYEQVDDLTWKFEIKDDLYFSNNKKVDGQSVAMCIQRAFDRNNRAREYFDLNKLEVNGQQITLTLNTPSGAVLNNLCEPLFTIYDATASEQEIANQPSCTGPYMVTSFKPESTVECAANSKYWDGEVGLETIKLTQIADSDSRVLALQSGEVDLVTTIDFSNLELFKDTSKYTISEVLGPRCNVVYLNNSSSFLSDKIIRQALSYSVDRQSIVQLTGGKEATGLYSSALEYGKNMEDKYAYNIDNAKKLLDEAGYIDTDGDGIREKGGKNIVLEYYESADHGSADSSIIAQSIQSEAQKAGISVRINQTENLADIKSSGKFDMCSANDSTAPTGDPEVFLALHYKTGVAGNIARYSNTDVDQAIDQLLGTFDTATREEIAKDVATKILDEAGSLYISYLPINTISNAKVLNANQHPVDYYMITKDIKLKDE